MDFDKDFGSGSVGSGGSLGSAGLKNPGVSLCHVLFRSAALLVYLFGTIFTSSFIFIFVVTTLLLSVDFWTVKNITGRIMAGLRWWNYIDDEGVSRWKFESRNGDSTHYLSASEVRLFWTALVAAPLLWLLLLLSALFSFKFQWMILVIIGLTLSSSNLFGYLRCRMGSTDSISSAVSGAANEYMRKRMVDNVMGMFRGGQPNQQPEQQTI